MHCLMLLLLHASVGGTDGRELFDDPRFERGFVVSAAGHLVLAENVGVLRITEASDAQAPAWRVAQWASRFLLEPGQFTALGNEVWQAETPGKRVRLERGPDGMARLLLEVKGSIEYDGRMRGAGEAWPHLLIEQSFGEPIRLEGLKGLSFATEMRIPFCKVPAWAEGKLNPGLHTGQVSAFWTIHNLRPDSPEYRDMFWFGIPLFDARHENPPGYYAIDGGKEDASGKFICLLDGKRFWTGNTGDGTWRKLDVDTIPLIREALAIAQEHGNLKQTRFEDLAITSFNLGWEIPGPYDAGLELRGLSFKAR